MEKKIIWTFIILLSIGAIIFSILLIADEFLNAKKECNNIEGDYSFKFSKGHLCNGRKFIKYRYCLLGDCELIWEFEDSINDVNLEDVDMNFSGFNFSK